MDYSVTISFDGIVGSDKDYTVWAESEDEAAEYARDEAADDLSVLDVANTDDGEYTVTVGFGDYIGVEEDYIVDADDEDEASEAALEAAKDDLVVGSVYYADDDDEGIYREPRTHY